MITLVIVDSDADSRHRLMRMVNEHFDHIAAVVGWAANLDEARQRIADCRPQMVFLDAEVAGASGFDLLQAFRVPAFSVVVTANSAAHALEAIEVFALDYLLKPIQPLALHKALHRFLIKDEKETVTRQLLENLVKQNSRRKIAISTLRSIEIVPVDDIVYLASDGSYSHLACANGARITSTIYLKEFEAMLRGHLFYRAHKSYLVNLEHVVKFTRQASQAFLTMSNGHEITVSATRKNDLFQELFDNCLLRV